MLIPLSIFAAITVVLLIIAIVLIRGGKSSEREVLSQSGRRPLVFGGLTEALAGVLPTSQDQRKKLSRFLRHAGHYHRLALAEFLAIRNALVVGWVILAAATFVVVADPGGSAPWWPLAAGALGTVFLFALPRLLLESIAAGRLRRIESSLPDALDMITMCTSGGLPVQQTLIRVGDELRTTHPDLAFELRVLGRQTEAGSLEGAIKQFARRVDTADVQSLAATIAQTDRQGTGVAAAFHEFADTSRQTRRQRADEMGNKTAVKMLFPLVFCLAPPVYIMLLAPAAIEMGQFVQRERQPGGALSASADTMSTAIQEEWQGEKLSGIFAPPSPEELQQAPLTDDGGWLFGSDSQDR